MNVEDFAEWIGAIVVLALLGLVVSIFVGAAVLIWQAVLA